MTVTLKSPREIELMRAAGQVVAEVHEILREHTEPGVTTGELNKLAHAHITKRGGVPSFLGYHGFPGSICTSVNEQIVHGIPGERVLVDGDIVSIDVGVILDRYHGDAARTLPVGVVSEETTRLIRVTEESFWAGVALVREGSRLGDVGFAIQKHAEAQGFHVVREYVGHGIGREMHESPQVPNYGDPGTGRRLRKGMTLAIEPMVNIGSPGTRQLDDGWTVVTRSGGYSAHYENTVCVTDGDADVLTVMTHSVV
ncbi:MAG: type I methionyl aminopeptidase [Thermomicrobiaceae bacterium]